MARQSLGAKFALAIVFAGYFCIRLSFLDFVPIFDGRHYMDCLIHVMDGPVNPLRYPYCALHAANLFWTLFVLPQYLDPGNIYFLNATTTLMGALGIWWFYQLTRLLFISSQRSSPIEVVLLTGLFAFNPTILSNSMNLNLDLGVMVFFLGNIYFIISGNWILALICGLFEVFSKEAGIVLYVYTVGSVGLADYFRGPGRSVKAWGLYLFRQTLPLTLFGLYFCYRHWVLDLETMHPVFNSSGLREFIRADFLSPRFLTYSAHLFIVNFHWVFSLLIGSHFIYWRFYEVKHLGIHFNRKMGIVLALLVLGFHALTRFGPPSNIRYLMPVIPLFFYLGYFALLKLVSSVSVRRGILLTILGLFVVSNFRTIDPVSRSVFGVFSVGDRSLLRMTKFTKEKLELGRDQTVYNLEALYLHYALGKAFSELPVANIPLVVDHYDCFWDDVGCLNNQTMHRSFPFKGSFVPNYLSVGMALAELPPALFFLSFPFYDSKASLLRLSSVYRLTGQKTYEHRGYQITIFGFQRDLSKKPDFFG